MPYETSLHKTSLHVCTVKLSKFFFQTEHPDTCPITITKAQNPPASGPSAGAAPERSPQAMLCLSRETLGHQGNTRWGGGTQLQGPPRCPV